MISGTVDGADCGSSQATLYYANDVGFTTDATVGCNAANIVTAYEWLTDNQNRTPDVWVVNESFGCVHQGSEMTTADDECVYEDVAADDGITQDWFARIANLPIVKAAGNQNCEESLGDPGGPDHEACPFTLNSICVGATREDGQMSDFSSFVNPGITSPLDDSDREEPDVVVYGGDEGSTETVCVADATYETGWIGKRGTSLAAPLVTSMIALAREQCQEEESIFISARRMRALVRTTAFGGDPEGPAYSTPRPTHDFKDGAGELYAPRLICGGVPGESGGEDLSIELDSDGEPMPEGDSPYHHTENSEVVLESPGETQSIKPQSFDIDPEMAASTLRNQVLLEIELEEGERIRSTIAWDACAAGATGTAPAAPSVDFDLFLYAPDQLSYVWASQSLDDNNEGLDYTVQPGESGVYRLLLVWDSEDVACDGQTAEEPVAHVWHKLSPP